MATPAGPAGQRAALAAAAQQPHQSVRPAGTSSPEGPPGVPPTPCAPPARAGGAPRQAMHCPGARVQPLPAPELPFLLTGATTCTTQGHGLPHCRRIKALTHMAFARLQQVQKTARLLCIYRVRNLCDTTCSFSHADKRMQSGSLSSCKKPYSGTLSETKSPKRSRPSTHSRRATQSSSQAAFARAAAAAASCDTCARRCCPLPPACAHPAQQVHRQLCQL